VLGRFQESVPKVAKLLEGAEEDLLAFYRFPAAHWPKLRSTNPLERANEEIGRRSDVVGIFPNDAAAIRLAGAVLIEQNDEWLVGRRYLWPNRSPWSSRTRAREDRGWPSYKPREEPDEELHHCLRLDCRARLIGGRNAMRATLSPRVKGE
jgi:Transposase, Mutator family